MSKTIVFSNAKQEADDDPSPFPPPCIHSKRLRVCQHHAHMLKTHVREVPGHIFSACHTPHTPHTTTQQHDHHTTRRQTRAWPFFIDGVLFLVCARDFSLLNSVKYDCSLISFSAFWPVNSYLIYTVTVFNFILLTYLLMQLQLKKKSELFSYAATVFFSNELCINIVWKGTRDSGC